MGMRLIVTLDLSNDLTICFYYAWGMYESIRLGVNIDHVATLRNARGGVNPDPLEIALLLENAGDTDLITIHLREDRRHIRDADVYKIRKECGLPLNLECAVTDDMLKIAFDVKPDWVCLVPENRLEITTEGGLAIKSRQEHIARAIKILNDHDIKVSLFIDPDVRAVNLSKDVGAQAVEVHTGAYANDTSDEELSRIQSAAAQCAAIELQCHAGHGLTYDNVKAVAQISNVEELNIGHYLVGEALKVGLVQSVRHMKQIISSQ